MTSEPTAPGLTASAEDYLKAVYASEHGGEPAATGDLASSERVFQESLALCEQKLGAEHYLMGELLMLYADMLERARRKREAQPVKKRALALLGRFSKENALGHTIDVRLCCR